MTMLKRNVSEEPPTGSLRGCVEDLEDKKLHAPHNTDLQPTAASAVMRRRG